MRSVSTNVVDCPSCRQHEKLMSGRGCATLCNNAMLASHVPCPLSAIGQTRDADENTFADHSFIDQGCILLVSFSKVWHCCHVTVTVKLVLVLKIDSTHCTVYTPQTPRFRATRTEITSLGIPFVPTGAQNSLRRGHNRPAFHKSRLIPSCNLILFRAALQPLPRRHPPSIRVYFP